MKNKINLLILIFTFCFLLIGCSFDSARQDNSNVDNSNISATTEKPPAVGAANPVANTNQTAATVSCSDLKRAELALDRKQTFAIDFPPFENSCFAVFHDPEFTAPALGAQYFIYRDGREVFEFPEQFNGGNVTCWVDAVAFEDVNADRLKDIIVAGKCGAKSGAYNENMVYINTGAHFKVNRNANLELMDFSKISQIKDYVREHPADFAR